MLKVGGDAHKQVKVAVALDERGRRLGQWRGPNAPQGWEELARWATRWEQLCQWGIEGLRAPGTMGAAWPNTGWQRAHGSRRSIRVGRRRRGVRRAPRPRTTASTRRQ